MPHSFPTTAPLPYPRLGSIQKSLNPKAWSPASNTSAPGFTTLPSISTSSRVSCWLSDRRRKGHLPQHRWQNIQQACPRIGYPKIQWFIVTYHHLLPQNGDAWEITHQMDLPWLQISTVRSVISKGAGPLKRKTSSHRACTCSKESLDLGETRLNSWMHSWYVSAVVEPSKISLQVFIWLKYSLQSSASLVWHMAGERTEICRVYGNPNTKFNSWKWVNRCKYHTDIQKNLQKWFRPVPENSSLTNLTVFFLNVLVNPKLHPAAQHSWHSSKGSKGPSAVGSPPPVDPSPHQPRSAAAAGHVPSDRKPNSRPCWSSPVNFLGHSMALFEVRDIPLA